MAAKLRYQLSLETATAPWVPLRVVGSVRALAVADVNHDGKADVLTLADVNGSSSAQGSVSVLLGNGDGTFLNTPAPVSSNGLALVEGDFNHDGKADLAAASGNGVVVMLGTGEGTFQGGVRYPVGGTGITAVSVLAGDFNHDGTTDLAAISQNPGTVSIFLGNGDGTFQAASNSTSGNEPLSFAAADLNGDGKLDLAVLNAGTQCTRGGTSDLVIFLGNGDGTLQVGLVTSLSTCANDLAAGDFNGDGKVDLIFGDGTVFLGNGDGSFQTQSIGADDNYLAVGDFNLDGYSAISRCCLQSSTSTRLSSTSLMQALSNYLSLSGAPCCTSRACSPESKAVAIAQGSRVGHPRGEAIWFYFHRRVTLQNRPNM